MILDRLVKLFRKSKPADVTQFRMVFERFQQVLEGNNHALELISQLEDKLSGDYIFDINYLKHITKALSEEMYRVIYSLNLMTGNRYTELLSRHAEIQAGLGDIIEGRTSRQDDRFIIPYDETNSDLIPVIGAKNALLAEVRNHLKLPTPDGFALSIHAYRHFMEYNDLWPKIHELYEALGDSSADAGCRHDAAIDDLFQETRVPPDLERAITRSVNELQKQHGSEPGFAVRSSAFGEDEEGVSFAGQFSSVLNCSSGDVIPAYIKVISSRFKFSSLTYNEKLASDESKLPMAVAVQQMIPSVSAGVVYTVDPSGDHIDSLVVTAGYGLGVDVVSGTASADYFQVSRFNPDVIKDRRIGKKESKLICAKGGGTESITVPQDIQMVFCLTDDQVYELSEIALLLDRCFKRPLDIEWCLDEKGVFHILQCRPLSLQHQRRSRTENLDAVLEGKERILYKKGQVAQRGIAVGKVRLVKEDDDLKYFPVGAIAVTKYTTPRLTSIIRRAAAIITDVGSSMGHMATVAREFGVPLIVNTVDATSILADGTEITVDAEENIVYAGIIKELLEYDVEAEDVFRDLKEYKILRQLLRTISPLFLIDPKNVNFVAKNCRTYHDILRFCHEKAVQELISLNMSSRPFQGIKAKPMQLPVPLDLFLIDLGGGMKVDPDGEGVGTIEQIRSIPMKALLKGLTAPGVWSTKPVNLGFGDLISSLTRYSMTDGVNEYQGQNLAVLSARYANISLRLGYHFNVIDTYVSENVNDNYIYFRFVGGVTDNERRHLRAILIKSILERMNFKVTVSGDLVVGNLKKWEEDRILEILEDVGRLIGFSRQLDTQMQNEESVEKYLDLFFRDDKNISC